MVTYGQLKEIAAVATSVTQVALFENPEKSSLLVKIAINKVYEKFHLKIRERQVSITSPNVIVVPVTSDEIRVSRFFIDFDASCDTHVREKYKDITPNHHDSPIRYTSNLEFAFDPCKVHSSLSNVAIKTPYTLTYTYLAEFCKIVPNSQDANNPLPTDVLESEPVFTEQYIEPFMTYMNYIIHRIVAYKDTNYLELYKRDFHDSVQDIIDNGLHYTNVSSESPNFVSRGYK